MLKSDLHPPEAGLDSDPVLYGVAAALADLFPPVVSLMRSGTEANTVDEDDLDQD